MGKIRSAHMGREQGVRKEMVFIPHEDPQCIWRRKPSGTAVMLALLLTQLLLAVPVLLSSALMPCIYLESQQVPTVFALCPWERCFETGGG